MAEFTEFFLSLQQISKPFQTHLQIYIKYSKVPNKSAKIMEEHRALSTIETEVRQVLAKFSTGSDYTVELNDDNELMVYTSKHHDFGGVIMQSLMKAMEKYLLDVHVLWYISTTPCYDGSGALRTVPCLTIANYEPAQP